MSNTNIPPAASQGRTIAWFSCGAASAVAAKLMPEAQPVYCATGAEHPDNARFMADCEKWLGRKITTLQSDEYVDTWDVWEKTRWLAGINGARCTTELKVGPRLMFQKPNDIHVFGYTSDKSDVDRANRMVENYPEMILRFPLIERNLDKSACLAIIQNAGIEMPPMYGLGFHNNNCIPCVKATSPAYWSLIRKEFPREFDRMAALSRSLGVRLTRIKGERKFIDEIPIDHPTTNPIAPACDFLCHLIETEMNGDGSNE